MSQDWAQSVRTDPSTIQHKFLVGYQGWFTCGGDGAGLSDQGWSHWLKNDDGLATDLWPDTSEYPPSELFPVPGLKFKTGEQSFLFSSCNRATVQRHFKWMARHGIDGVFLQRFVGQCDPLNTKYKIILKWRDTVGDNCLLAAEAEGRTFSIMYDVSGVNPNRVQQILEQDWLHLIRDKRVLDSPNYLKERDRPVVCLWGFGFCKTHHKPNTVRQIVSFFRECTPGGVYLIAGVPTHWRTADGDADPNPEFLSLWLNAFDGISPWTVGRYRNEAEATTFANVVMKKDIELLNARNRERPCQGLRSIDYIPVILPGASGHNMSDGKWAFNDIKREGGHFLWRQIYNALGSGVKILYGATWDEYDEGTALMPSIESKLLLPVSHRHPLLALDEDGYSVPSDWYMRICGLAAEYLHGDSQIGESFPFERLQDYWITQENEGYRGRPPQSRISSESEFPPPPYHSSQSRRATPQSSRDPTSTPNRSFLRGPRSRPLPPAPGPAGIVLAALDDKINRPDLAQIGDDIRSTLGQTTGVSANAGEGFVIGIENPIPHTKS